MLNTQLHLGITIYEISPSHLQYCLKCIILASLLSNLSNYYLYTETCGSGWESFGNYCFYFAHNARVSFDQAQTECHIMGSNLTSIHSEEEQNFVGRKCNFKCYENNDSTSYLPSFIHCRVRTGVNRQLFKFKVAILLHQVAFTIFYDITPNNYVYKYSAL